MLRLYSEYCCLGFVLVSVICWACAGYAYRVNRRLPDDDPRKRNYRSGGIVISLFIWPLIFIGSLFILIVAALVYVALLILFTIALILFRKSFLLTWLQKIALSLGNSLLRANSFFLGTAPVEDEGRQAV